MSRFVALALAAAALAAPGATAASAEECHGTRPAGVCYERRCRDHHCIVRDYTIYSDCQHPLPPLVCAVSAFKTTVPGVIL